MFYQIFFSLEVRRSAIHNYKHGIWYIGVASRFTERLKTEISGNEETLVN